MDRICKLLLPYPILLYSCERNTHRIIGKLFALLIICVIFGSTWNDWDKMDDLKAGITGTIGKWPE
jgi:hypothetical protein